MQCSERNKMTHKNDPCSGGIPGLGVNNEKEKDRTYRKVFHQLDIFPLDKHCCALYHTNY